MIQRHWVNSSQLLCDPKRAPFPATYTLNVTAVDQKGYQSLPSAPIHFITGTPASSTCAVTYQVSTGWGSGFVASQNGPTLHQHRSP